MLTVPPQILFIKYDAYSKPSITIFVSKPLSKRYLASEFIPRDLPVFATLFGLKRATSRNTFLVSSVHPLKSPPIIPAIARVFLLSAITVVFTSKLYSLLSKARIFSFEFASLISSCFSTLSASKTCKGLPKSRVIKFVISTKALIGLKPRLRSFFCNQSGDLELLTFLKYLLTTYSQLLLSFLIFHEIGLSNSKCSILSNFKGFNFPKPLADKSLATPLMPRQSPLFGVMPISNIGSFNFNASIAEVPFLKLPNNSIMPS